MIKDESNLTPGLPTYKDLDKKRQQHTCKPCACVVIANTFGNRRENSRKHSYDPRSRNRWSTPLERVWNIKPWTVIYKREFCICSSCRIFGQNFKRCQDEAEKPRKYCCKKNLKKINYLLGL